MAPQVSRLPDLTSHSRVIQPSICEASASSAVSGSSPSQRRGRTVDATAAASNVVPKAIVDVPIAVALSKDHASTP